MMGVTYEAESLRGCAGFGGSNLVSRRTKQILQDGRLPRRIGWMDLGVCLRLAVAIRLASEPLASAEARARKHRMRQELRVLNHLVCGDLRDAKCIEKGSEGYLRKAQRSCTG